MNRYVFLGFFVVACGGAEAAPETPERPERSVAGLEEPIDLTASRGNPRNLDSNATYGDLVTSVHEAEEAGVEASTDDCLLHVSEEGIQFRAELAAALHPIPRPRLLRPAQGPVRILTRWGQQGSGRTAVSALVLEPALTENTRSLVFFISDEDRCDDLEVIIRTPDGSTNETLCASDFSMEAVSAQLDNLSDVRVYLSAAPTVRLDSLLPLLREIDSTVVFASPVPEDTTLPEPLTETGELLCDRLQPAPEMEVGTLDSQTIRSGLEEIREALLSCNSMLTSAYRRLEVRLDIEGDTTGRIARMCVTGDTQPDHRLRQCVAQAMTRARFAAPNGRVQVEMPLVFQAPLEAQPTFCQL